MIENCKGCQEQRETADALRRALDRERDRAIRAEEELGKARAEYDRLWDVLRWYATKADQEWDCYCNDLRTPDGEIVRVLVGELARCALRGGSLETANPEGWSLIGLEL